MPLDFSHSLRLFEKAKKLIPSCTQTLSKGWTQYPFGVSPIFLEKADGCYVWDVDGNKFIDWPMALGPVIFGHNYAPVNDAVKKQIDNGVAFSLPHYREIELAERLCEIIPCAEMVRFGKNGSDATSGAVRLARAYTGRDMIACCGYHGWQDWYIGTTSRSLGVPEAVKSQTVVFEYNNPESLRELFDKYTGKIACVIMEPVNLVPPENKFLENINDIAHRNGAIVIYDECWTGFRWAPGGAQEYFGVTPDLACFGKALGNGFPVSAIVGRKQIMTVFDKVFYSFTFGGDLIGITAALAVLEQLEETDVISKIWDRGAKMTAGVNRLINKNGLEHRVCLEGYPPKTVVAFETETGDEDLLLKSYVQQEMIARGLLYAGYHVISLSHPDAVIEETIDAYEDIFNTLGRTIGDDSFEKSLKGTCIQPVFR